MSVGSNLKAFSEQELLKLLDNFVSDIGLEGVPNDELLYFNADKRTEMGTYGTETGSE